MKVVFFIRTFVGRAGGAERVLCDTANALVRAGADVAICHTDEPGAAFFALDPAVRLVSIRPAGVEIRRYGSAPRGRPTGRAMLRYRFPISVRTWLRQHIWHVRAIRRFLREERPHLAIAFQPSATTDTLLGAWRLGVPVVASLHNVPTRDLYTWERWDPNPLDRWLRRQTLRLAAAVTVLLPEFIDLLPAFAQQRAVVIPNAVRLSVLQADPGEAATGRVIAVGRLSAAKDHATLVSAWQRLRHRYPGWCVEIYGSGPLGKALARQIEDEGLQDCVFLRGETDEIGRHYLEANVFCMPSLFEGFGMATVEALSAGLPAVGFIDCPGTNSLIVDGCNGLLADPSRTGGDRVQALSARLDQLLGDVELRRRLAAAAPASVAQFNEAAVASLWVDLVNRVGGGARCPRMPAPRGE